MLNEVLKISSPSTSKTFIDCTFGGGGYSKEILKFLKTKVLALDRDKKVLIEKPEENKNILFKIVKNLSKIVLKSPSKVAWN